MAVTTLLRRNTPTKRQNVVSLFVSASQVAIGISKGGRFKADISPVATDPWLAALKLLEKQSISKTAINLVLGQGFYQTFLIDNPGLSNEDRQLALPFQLKDVISDPPSQVIADGYGIPIANRFQAFVARKTPVVQFAQSLAKYRCWLNVVSVEDLALQQWVEPDRTEMVITTDAQGNPQLTVFSADKLCFQRQIRDLKLDDDILNAEKLDELALEVQRSIDYLRSQLKKSPISGIVVSLQGVDNGELAFKLNTRLSVAARSQTWFEGTEHIGHIAIAALNDGFSSNINLFRPDLLPKTPWLTFEKMLVTWGVTALAFVVIGVFQQWQLSERQAQLRLLESQVVVAQSMSDALDLRLKNHVPSLSLVNDVKRTEETIAIRRAALDAVRQHDAALQRGYANTFRALAAVPRRDISLNEIFVSLHALDLKGTTRSPDSVPAWIQRFQTQPALANRVFEEMVLERDTKDKKQLNFSLLSKRDNPESSK